jgi:S-disulfanyl-L-cysteine oxidoreductase SoxD
MRIVLLFFVLTAPFVFAGCDKLNGDPVKFADSYDSSAWPATFGLGRVALAREIDSLNIDVRPDGEGLPEGSGTVLQGKYIYIAKCAICHGHTGTEGPYAKLVGIFHESDSIQRGEKTIGNYWPYASTLYDYINRAMPYNTPGTLTSEEVYSITAFLLYRNNIIDSTIVMDARTLPKVIMPAQKLFIDDDRTGGSEIR